MDQRPPKGYVEPISVWLVEFLDNREPGERFQAGAFTTEAEAQRLLVVLEQAGGHEGLRINMCRFTLDRKTGIGTDDRPTRGRSGWLGWLLPLISKRPDLLQ